MRLCLYIVLVLLVCTRARLMRYDHQCTVILIELPCIFFLPEILDIQGFSASAGITEPVLESFPGRAFSVYSVFVFSSRCNFGRRYSRAIVPVVTLKIKLLLRCCRCNFDFPVDTLKIITAMIWEKLFQISWFYIIFANRVFYYLHTPISDILFECFFHRDQFVHNPVKLLGPVLFIRKVNVLFN